MSQPESGVRLARSWPAQDGLLANKLRHEAGVWERSTRGSSSRPRLVGKPTVGSVAMAFLRSGGT